MKLNTAKKLTAGALALSMMFAMAVPMAFAEGGTEVVPSTDPHITKKYTATNDGTSSPAETFTFTAVATKVKDAGVKADGSAITKDDAPELTIQDAVYIANGATTAGAEKNLTITHEDPFPNVGIYYYTVTEDESENAGVKTHEGAMLLKVSVGYNEAGTALEETYAFYNGMNSTTGEGTGTKGAAIGNTYSAGSLEVKKFVTGSLGDKNKKFNVTVTFTAPAGKTVAGDISYVEGGETKTIAPRDWKEGSVTKKIAVAHNDTITFTNIPYDVTYTVVEDDYTKTAGGAKDYDEAKYEYSDTNPIKAIDSANDTVTITNHKGDDNIDTGVILDNAPYILMLAVVAAGAMTLVIKKRREEE